MDDSTKNLVPRSAVEYICRKETVSTNPDDFTHSEMFIRYLDHDAISSFGKWQWANGYNTALVAVKCGLDKIPSIEPEPCEDAVSRKEAVREAKELFKLGECHADECSIIGMLNSLPSVQQAMKTTRKTIYLDDALEAIRKLPNAGIHWLVSAEAVFDSLLELPSAQPEPSQIARDICTILENEQDMRVILKNAQPEPFREEGERE